MILFFFFFKQKTAYELRISDWSSDVCSSDLTRAASPCWSTAHRASPICRSTCASLMSISTRSRRTSCTARPDSACCTRSANRSEEHTSELQSLMRISYAVFCLQKKIQNRFPIAILPLPQTTNYIHNKQLSHTIQS